ncbi:MAG TPA: PQQ-binding-like beta-propeller repeat protein, partial [Tepidisphaeraceae bacterium]|nr:PQQ-binding-like beta-propeller repeat protein [Tepidisphaeraceae bacterium]
WPQFRGPTGQGLSAATGLPVEWSASKNVAWKVEIPGRGWSSPALSAGRIYLTTSIGTKGGPVSLHALCLEASTGKLVWDVEVFRPDEAMARQMHGKNSAASPTPYVTADRVYVHFGHMGTAALDLSGQIVWKETTLKYPPVHGNGGSPALVGNTLVFSCDGASNPFVAGLDARSGAVKWKTPRNTTARKNFSFCTPLAIEVNGSTQVVLPGSGFVAAYEPQTGREIWRVKYDQGYSVVPRPVFADGMVFVSSGFDHPIVYAIDPAGAQGDVTDTHVKWTHIRGGPNTPSLLVTGDDLFMVSDLGIASCLDAKTGNVNWTHRLNGTFSASPVFAEGRVYFQSEAGVGIVVNASKTFQQLAENDLGERSLASYAVTDGAIFIRTEHHLWKISGGAK